MKYTTLTDIRKAMPVKMSSEAIFKTLTPSMVIYSSPEDMEFLIDITIPVIGDAENTQFLHLYNWIKHSNFHNAFIYIVLPRNFERFTSTFISTLYLFNQGLQCNFIILGYAFCGPAFEFLHLSSSGLLSQANLDFFSYGSYLENNRIREYKKNNTDRVRKAEISEKHLPLIAINKDNFEYYFKKTTNELLEQNGKNYKIGNDTYKDFYNRHIENLEIKEENRDLYLITHFYKLLDNIHCLYDSAKYEDNKNYRRTDYFDKIQKEFVVDIRTRPIYFSLILLPLLNANYVRENFLEIHQKNNPDAPGKVHNKTLIYATDNYLDYIRFLKGQYNVADEIYKGVYELAKNMVEHTQYHSGIITVKTLTQDSLQSIKSENENTSLWNDYIDSTQTLTFADKEKRYLDISIVDRGEKGILETSLHNMRPGKRTKAPEEIWRTDIITEESREKDRKTIVKSLRRCNGEKYPETKLLFDMYFNTAIEPLLKRQKHSDENSRGLSIFTRFITRANGIFSVQTSSALHRSQTISFAFHQAGNEYTFLFRNSENPFGTSFNIILPLKKQTEKTIVESVEDAHDESAEDSRKDIDKTTLEKLLPLQLSPFKSGEKYNQGGELDEKNCYFVRDTWAEASEPKMLVYYLDGNEDISILSRFIHQKTLSDIKVFVFVTSRKLMAKDLLDDFDKVKSSGKTIAVITEEEQPDTKEKNIFFALLCGDTLEQCKEINRYIKQKEISYRIMPEFCDTFSEMPDESKVFYDELLEQIHILVPVTRQGCSLFEKRVTDELNESIDKKYNQPKKKRTGYNWQKTHLKISSKLHLDDFVYGKKMFQQSRNASVFAFLLARDIIGQIESRIPQIKQQKTIQYYTLIGYGRYSELLVSRACSFLEYYINRNSTLKQKIQIENIIVEDTVDIRFSDYIHNFENRRNKDTHENLIVIVPISSTLTTCLKIENTFYEMLHDGKIKNIDTITSIENEDIEDAVKKQRKDEYFKSRFRFIPPFNTIVVVGDGKGTPEVDDDKPFEPEDIEKHFTDSESNKALGMDFSAIDKCWKGFYVEGKTITTRNRKEKSDEEGKRKNHYIIYIKSKWRLPISCIHCFPQNPIEERPLFVTDKVSVTPSLIFSAPQWYQPYKLSYNPYFVFNKKGEEKENIPKDAAIIQDVHWAHYKADNKHYNYYIHYLDFINENKDRIKGWAEKIKAELLNGSSEQEFSAIKTLLIAPDKPENGGFINMVNREIFEDKAEILRFDKNSDHYLNFDMFFKDTIRKADKIYFVDNSMLSGKQFLALDSIIKDTQNQQSGNPEDKKLINGVFCMINRMDFNCHHTIMECLNRNNLTENCENLYSFVDFKVPESVIMPCPLCHEREKYEDLKKRVSLDCIKQYYVRKEIPYFTTIEKSQLTEGHTHYENKKHSSTTLKTLLINFLNQSFDEYERKVRQDDPFVQHNDKDFRTQSISRFYEEKLPDDGIGQEYLDFNTFVETFRRYIINRGQDNLKSNETAVINDFKFKSNLIKVLSDESFKKHRGVHISVFYWVLNDLIAAARAILPSEKKWTYSVTGTHTEFSVLKKVETPEKLESTKEIDIYIDTINYMLIRNNTYLNISPCR